MSEDTERKHPSFILGNKVVYVEKMNGNININVDTSLSTVFLGMVGVMLEHASHQSTFDQNDLRNLNELIYMNQPGIILNNRSLDVQKVTYGAWFEEGKKQIALIYETNQHHGAFGPRWNGTHDDLIAEKYVPIIMQIDESGLYPSVTYTYVSHDGIQVTSERTILIHSDISHVGVHNLGHHFDVGLSQDTFHPVTSADVQAIYEHIDDLHSSSPHESSVLNQDHFLETAGLDVENMMSWLTDNLNELNEHFSDLSELNHTEIETDHHNNLDLSRSVFDDGHHGTLDNFNEELNDGLYDEY